MRAVLRTLIGAGCVVIGALSAHGQNFPSKTITIVVPAAPGGVTDALGRVLAQLNSVWPSGADLVTCSAAI